MRKRMEFEDFLAYKGDEIDNAAYELAAALLRTHPEQTAEDILAWDMSVICPIVEAAQTALQKAGKKNLPALLWGRNALLQTGRMQTRPMLFS